MAADTVTILVFGDNSHGIAEPLKVELAKAFTKLHVDPVLGIEQIDDYCAGLTELDHVAIAIATSEVANIDALIFKARTHQHLSQTQWLVVSDAQVHRDLTQATKDGILSAIISAPWSLPLLAGQVYSTMLRYLNGYSHKRIRELIGRPPDFAVQGPLLKGLSTDEREVVMKFLEGVERVLGRRPRIQVPPGTHLLTEGKPVAAVNLVLEGKVSLYRDARHGEVLAHLASSGPIIGLVSLARGEDAFFSAVTTVNTTLVRLTTEQLQIVISNEPSIGSALTALAIGSLTRRLMRAEELHVENATLAEDLEAQKQALARTNEDLRQTRAELVEQARFAMLGELSAGIAHELNNPVTALLRAAGHLTQDVDMVLSCANPEIARSGMHQGMHSQTLSTAVERQLTRELLPLVGDRNLTRTLVSAGVGDQAQVRELMSQAGAVKAFQNGARLGQSLRSVLAAGQRVTELTQSLKGYARPDTQEGRPVDLRANIDDVLRLTAHRLRNVEVERNYDDVPEVLGFPAKLSQVWTNLIVNAAEAIDDEAEDLTAGQLPARGENKAHITITVTNEAQGVHVSIEDNGPGIEPHVLEKIMEPHFTTKAGRVRFGLGMGMPIVRSIIADHGGHFSIDSHPGCTRMHVLLPLAGADNLFVAPLPTPSPQEES